MNMNVSNIFEQKLLSSLNNVKVFFSPLLSKFMSC